MNRLKSNAKARRGRLAVKVLFACATIFASSSHAAERNAFGYTELTQLIRDKNLRSVDDVVPLLPEEFRANFTLMRDSKSLQRSEALHPRAILFNDTAQTIFTFGGKPGLAASSNIEVMEFDKTSNTFRLHEVAFTAEGPHFASDQEIKQKCSACHGEFVHPIWMNYPQWTGAFGQLDDFLSDDELQVYTAFRRANQTRPSMKWLYADHENDPYWPYSHSQLTRADSRMPNFRFEIMLSMMWARAAASQIMKSPLFEKAKYSLVYKLNFVSNGNLLGLEPLVDAAPIPADLHWTKSRAAWKKQTLADQNFLEVFGIPYGDLSLNVNRAQLGSTGTGLFFGDSAFNMTDGYVASLIAQAVANQDSQLLQRIEAAPRYDVPVDQPDPDLVPVFKHAILSSPLNRAFKINEAYLISKMKDEQAALKNQKFEAPKVAVETSLQARLPVEKPEGLRVIERVGCLGCHGAGGFAPMIRFDQPSAFAAQNLTAAKHGESLLMKVRKRLSSQDPDFRMPYRGDALTEAEQQAVLKYLSNATRSQ